jgi:hypothetical protein
MSSSSLFFEWRGNPELDACMRKLMNIGKGFGEASCKIPITKFQTPNKLQLSNIQITKIYSDQSHFRILVIGIW